jgi:prepilin-type N-terminal cleavage/methylation domain-containing protein
MTRANRPTRSSQRHGFTLVEVLVVLIIIAFFATIIVPRFTSNVRRSFDLTVDRVSDLLMMYAQRDNLGNKTIGLEYDDQNDWLHIVVLEGDPEESGALPQWKRDPYINPVKLPDVLDDAMPFLVWADGEQVDISRSTGRPLSHTPGEDRPTIEISLFSNRSEFDAHLVLAPYDLSARRMDVDGSTARTRIDLDAIGRSREDW